MRLIIRSLVWLSCNAAAEANAFLSPASEPTVLGIDGARFTINGTPTFLLGISYYGALSAPEDSVRRDLDDLERHQFNWLRI